jgi:hypoxanthine phosphoribosyltransferase
MEKLITSSQIKWHTGELAKKINKQHPSDGMDVVFICMLNGGFMFFSDLVKLIDIKIEIDFMQIKSYNGKQQGEIQILKDIQNNIHNKHVYIVDDFLDTGNTMKAAIEHLEKSNPLSISIVTLLAREDSPTFENKTYEIFMLKDEWVAGYGLDNNGLSRNLPEIYKL